MSEVASLKVANNSCDILPHQLHKDNKHKEFTGLDQIKMGFRKKNSCFGEINVNTTISENPKQRTKSHDVHSREH